MKPQCHGIESQRSQHTLNLPTSRFTTDEKQCQRLMQPTSNAYGMVPPMLACTVPLGYISNMVSCFYRTQLTCLLMSFVALD